MKIVATLHHLYVDNGYGLRAALAQAAGLSEEKVVVACPVTAMADGHTHVSIGLAWPAKPEELKKLQMAVEGAYKQSKVTIDVFRITPIA